MKLPKWKLKLMKDLIKGKVTLVKTRMGYQYKTKTKMSKEELKVGDKVLSNGDEIEITQEMLDYYKRCKTIFGITDYVKLNQNKEDE